MAITLNTGLVDDLDILQNERVVDMAPEIAMLQKDLTQFTTMLMKVRSRAASSSEVEWLEDELFPRLSAVAATAATADTTIDVTTGEGAYFRDKDIVRVTTTGEVVRVTSVSTDTLTVVRGIGSTSATTAATGAEMIIIGNAEAQGGTLGVRAVTERVHQYNYTQIFRHPYSFTNTLKASKLYGQENAIAFERRKKAVEHKRAIEYALYSGVRDNQAFASDTEPTGIMGGLEDYLSTNIHDAGGALTSSELDGFLESDLQHGSTNKILFVSPVAARAISGFAASGSYHIDSPMTQERFGVKIDTFVQSAFGTSLPTIVKRDWKDFAANEFSMGGSLWCVDMDSVWLRPLRTTQLLLSREANDADLTSEEYLTELTFEVAQEKHHGKTYGITS